MRFSFSRFIIYKTYHGKYRGRLLTSAQATQGQRKSAIAYYIVHYQKNNILSLSVFYYWYSLGAHGSTVQEAYNLNLVNGERIPLPDILKEKKDYLKIINQEIKRQIKLNPEAYFDDGAVFQSISEGQQPFYVIEDGIVIYFGLYEIAPYSSGIRYFKIPFSLFETY